MSVEERIRNLCEKAPHYKIGIICEPYEAAKILVKTHPSKEANPMATAIFFKLYGNSLVYTRTDRSDPLNYCQRQGYPIYRFDDIVCNVLNKIEKNYNI